MLAAVYAVGVHITVGRLSVRPSVSRPSVCPVDRQQTKSADFVGLSETRADPVDFVWSGPVGPVWWNLAITGRLWIVAGTRAMLSSDWHRHRLIISQKHRPNACLLSLGWLGSRVVSVLDSGTEGSGIKSQSRRCRVTVLGKLFTTIVPLFTKQQNW